MAWPEWEKNIHDLDNFKGGWIITQGVKDIIEPQLKDDLNHSENKEEVIIDQKTLDWFQKIEDAAEKKSAILDYLKTKCLDKREWVTEYWVKWTHYCLTLPSVNWSECKKIKWFISDKKFTRNEYESNEILRDRSSTFDEVSIKLFCNIRDFFWGLGVSEDVGINFVKELLWNDDARTCATWENFKELTDLKDYWFRLKDTKWDYPAARSIGYHACRFGRINDYDWDANLFWWLTVE